MTLWELFLIAAGLSMDAFAVSICKGLSVQKADLKHSCIAGLWFGGFQALMPAAGYALGISFSSLVTSIDHWIAFILLALIGANMIRESFSDDQPCDASFRAKAMFPLAVATSIDALAVGVTFAFLRVNLILAVSFIGCITFLFSAVGIRIGNLFGARYRSRAELAGGIVLLLMGVKILLSHLGLFPF